MNSTDQTRIPRLRFRFVVASALIFSVWLVDSISFRMRCHEQFRQINQAYSSDLSLFVCRHDYHLFLTDHARSLIAFSDGNWVDSVELYSDPGAGGVLHYVRRDNEFIAVDMNGSHYQITKRGIKALGWKWREALPYGELKRVYSYGSSQYIDEAISHPPKLNDVYIYKDPGS